MATGIKRRRFLKSAAALASFSIVPAHVLRAQTAPSNQLTRALIGFGGIAKSGNHLGFTGSRMIAVCDPDESHVKQGLAMAEKKGYGKIHGCKDFREILEMK